MGEASIVKVREMTATQNFRHSKKPDWYDEGVRVYSGFEIWARGRAWHEIATRYDGSCTVAYLTRHGFDVTRHGPEIRRTYSEQACHRRLVREFFREHGMEVEYA